MKPALKELLGSITALLTTGIGVWASEQYRNQQVTMEVSEIDLIHLTCNHLGLREISGD